jgi:hypothetical protein
MKKWLKRLLKTLLYFILSWIIILIAHSFLDDLLYDFKITKYTSELDSLFNKDINNLYVEYKYRSGDRGTIYFVSIGTSKLIIVEANNFKNIVPSKVQTDSIEKVNFTDWKTYSTILQTNFPVVEAALNPKKSDFIKILLLKPYNIETEERKGNHFYLSGNLRSVVFSNSQLCYIITSSKKPDLLVLTLNNKLYIVVGEMKNGSLLNLINPKIL